VSIYSLYYDILTTPTVESFTSARDKEIS